MTSMFLWGLLPLFFTFPSSPYEIAPALACETSLVSPAPNWSVSGTSNSSADIFLGNAVLVRDAHTFSADIVLGSALAQGATVSANFYAGWMYHSSGSGYVTLNSTRDVITVYYSQPDCANTDGAGLLTVISVNNNGTYLDHSKLVNAARLDIITVLDPD